MLNALAEVMYFADRRFYDAWWNSGSVGTYWRLWNLPVHNYLKRHVYIPLRRRGWSNISASILVFFLSAVVHEILFGVPTHAVASVSSELSAVNWCRVPCNDGTNTACLSDRTTGEDERTRNNDRQLHFLDHFLSCRTAIRGIILLLPVCPLNELLLILGGTLCTATDRL
jgi:hypothetical protein